MLDRARLHSPRRKPVRHAVIGLGGFGWKHARATSSSRVGSLVAVVDSDPDTLRRGRDFFGVPGFSDTGQLISAGLAESVSVVLPHRIKSEVAEECLHAGLHVYAEKPLAIFQDTAENLVQLASRRNLQLAVGHQNRTFAGHQTLKGLLEEGPLGDIQQVLWTWHFFKPNTSFEAKPWLKQWTESGGGLLAYSLAHDLDLLCWLFGPARRVGALLTDQLHGLGVEDSVSAIIEFEQGAIATVQASYNRPWESVVRQVVGERGMVVIQGARSLTYDRGEDIRLGLFEPPPRSVINTAHSQDKDPPASQPKVSWQDVPSRPAIGQEAKWKRPRRIWRKLHLYRERREFFATIDNFLGAVRGREPLLVPGESVLPEVMLRNAMVLSAVTGRFVDVPSDTDECRAAYEAGPALL